MSKKPPRRKKRPTDPATRDAVNLIEAERRDKSGDLDLSRLLSRELPETIWELKHLESLKLGGNNLVKLPQSVGNLTRLRHLDLYDNQLAELPETIWELKHLESLQLGDNRLAELPQSVGNLTRLRRLDLYDNQLAELPKTIGQLSQLRHLSLTLNKLTVLPETFGDLINLERIFLAGNQLTTFPESITGFANLTALSIGGNSFTQLPQHIGRLQSLEILDLTSSGDIVVSWEPQGFWHVYNGRRLSGELTALPAQLMELGALKQLYLHGNPKLGLLPEVLGASWYNVIYQRSESAKPTEILDYYFRTREGKRPLNEAKLILVGRGAVGKTSLVNRLVYDRFNKDEGKTEGIRITEWPLRLNGKEDVRLNVWDFGGQEIMHATHQFFLTQRSLYLIVLTGRGGGEDADAEYWLKLVESFGGDSPVIMVLNKIKEQSFDLNRRALRQKYPSIRGFVMTDCEDATGAAELRALIERETDRLEHLRDAFPASWFTIKEHLAGLGGLEGEKRNYLSFDEYREVCARLGETEKEGQERLAGYLHTLGIALNYKDDPRLQETHVLNPHWVTSGIYRILNAAKLTDQQGVLCIGDLAAILDEAEYPRRMHGFLLDLMKKFDLCFSFPSDDGRYLVPELLNKQEPQQTEEFDPEGCLNFQYHYTVLPEGLLPRFIVRTHARSEGLPRWRTGVILEFEGCRALVKADVQDRKVFVSVSGPTANRRRLLAVVRSYFDEIHYHISRLQPQEMVPVPGYPDLTLPYEKLLVLESSGLKKYQEVAGGRLVELDVAGLLNGVDLEGTRRKEPGRDARGEAVRLFISYSHKDEQLRKQLETHLKLLQRQGLIETWHDRLIEAGDEWKKRIDDNLERADVILLLVSADFIASDYCYELELKHALERHRRGEALVIPIIVRDVDWTPTEFADLQVLPKDGKPVAKWRPKDSAWRNVAEKLRAVVEEKRAEAGRPGRAQGTA